MKKAIYAGSFDPFHYGHQNLVERASRLFDEVIVVRAVNPAKKYALTDEQAMALIRRSLSHVFNVKVMSLPGHYLAVDQANELDAQAIIKGVRTTQDVEYERMLHEISVSQSLGVETVVLFAEPKFHKVSSTAVKELIKFHGDVKEYCPLWVKQQLEVNANKYIYGITGGIGSGKSWLTRQLCTGTQYAIRDCGVDAAYPKLPYYNVDLDVIAKETLYPEKPNDEIQYLQNEISRILDVAVRNADGSYNISAIGKKFFGKDNDDLRAEVNKAVRPVILRAIRHNLASKGAGLYFLNGALLIDGEFTSLCNNNVLMVVTPMDRIKARLAQRYQGKLTVDEIDIRIKSQLGEDDKFRAMESFIKRDGHGTVDVFLNTEDNTFDNDARDRMITRVIHPVVGFRTVYGG